MAVSAVTPRVPLTIALTRLAGTCSSAASALALSFSGLRYSSRRISPGWVVMRVGRLSIFCPKTLLHAFRVARDDGKVGARRLVGLGAAVEPLCGSTPNRAAKFIAAHP